VAHVSRSYLVYGTSGWDAPWLTEQQLAAALSRRHPVLYVEPPLSPITPFRYGLRSREVGQPGVRALLRRRPRREGATGVFQPLALPPLENPRARRASAPLMRAQLSLALRRQDLTRPVTVSGRFHEGTFGLAGESARVYLVKDWVQAGAELIGQSRASIDAAVRWMCDQADLVCAISQPLQKALAEWGVAAELLPHGFDAELASAFDGVREPPELRELPRPLLGFTGRIDGRLDFQLLDVLAAEIAGTIVLIGPRSPLLSAGDLELVRRRENIVLLGVRSREQLPAYLAHLDLCLLPYREGEWGRYGSPLKLWEYLYAGPPIVGTGYEVLRDYPPPLVTYASGFDELLGAVRESLASEGGRDQRRAFALANTWDDRAEALDRLVAPLTG